MELPNITIKAIVENLKFLEGRKLEKIQEITNNFYKFRFGREQLIVSDTCIYLTKKTIPAKQTSSGFGAFLNKKLAGKTMKEIKQRKFERIIIMDFGEMKIILELFAKGNIILVDNNENILSAYKKQDFGKRELKKEQKYEFPPEKKSPFEIELEENEILIKQLIKNYNLFPKIIEYAAGKCKVFLKEKAKNQNTECLKKEIEKIYSEKHEEFCVEEETIFPAILGKKEGKLMELLDNNISQKIQIEEKNTKKKDSLKKSFEEMEQREKELKEKEIEAKEKAEEIYQNYSLIKEIKDAINKEIEKKVDKKEIEEKIKQKIKELKEINFKDKKFILEVNDQVRARQQ